MRNWSDNPFDPTVNIASLPVGQVLSEDDGESKQVYEIARRPGWLAKIYKKPLSEEAINALYRLIHLPAGMSKGNLTVVDECIAWPVAAIADGLQIVGVVMAKAPTRFFAKLRKMSGAMEASKPLPVDWLVNSDAACRKRGLIPADLDMRKTAMLHILRVGALFDDYDIVYADWSYKNTFWEQGTGAVFVIDMDSCGIGSRAWIESPEWDDPLFPESTKPPLSCLSDRYKLAVLTVRCLTGERKDPLTAHRILMERIGKNAFTSALHQTLTTKVADDRLSPYGLLAAYARYQTDAAGNVSGAIPVGRVRIPQGNGNVTGHVDLKAKRNRQTPTPPSSAHDPPFRYGSASL